MRNTLRALVCAVMLCVGLLGGGAAGAETVSSTYQHASGVAFQRPSGWIATQGNAHAPNQPRDMVTFGRKPHHHELAIVVLQRSDQSLQDVASNIENRYYGEPDTWQWHEQESPNTVQWHTTRILPDGEVLNRESWLVRTDGVTCWLYTQYGNNTDAETVQKRKTALTRAGLSLTTSPATRMPEARDFLALAEPPIGEGVLDTAPTVASFKWPTTGYVGYIYGRPVSYGSKGYHDGVDIITSMPAGNGRGNEIYAVYQGRVDGISADPATGRNYAVRIQHSSAGVYSHYLHMADSSTGQSYIECSVGQDVTTDTRIGWQGDQQYYSWGDCFTHLHFTISTGSTMASDIDPSPYLGYKLNWSDPDHVDDWHYIERGGSSGGEIPDAPGSVSASEDDSSKIHVTWSSVSGATRYDVYRSTSATDVNENQYRENNISGTSWDDYGADADRDYYYWVTACNDQGCSKDEGNWGGPDLGRKPSGGPSGGDVSGGPWHAGYDDTRTCYDDHSQCEGNFWFQEDIPYHGGETLLDMDWGTRNPDGAADGDDWTGMFQGTFDFEPGSYVFIIDHDDYVKFKILSDEHQRNNAGSDYYICKDGGGYDLSGEVPLTVYLWEDGGDARIRLRWTTDCSVCEKPDTPSNVQATDGDYDNKVRITWNSVAGAERYEVHRSDSESGTIHWKQNTTSTSWEDTDITRGQTYWYWVKACKPVGCSEFASDTGYAQAEVTVPSAPTNVQASDGDHTGFVRVTWDAVSGADEYEVYCATSPTANKWLRQRTASTSYDDYGAEYHQTYTYWVKACSSAGCSGFSGSDTGYRGTPAANHPIQFYIVANYGGLQCSIDEAGHHSFETFGPLGDNAVSSVLIQDGWSLLVFDEPDYTGPFACLEDSDFDLSNNTFDDGSPMDNAISSMIVYESDQCPQLPKIIGVDASDGTYADKVRITWQAAPHAEGYGIARAPHTSGTTVYLGHVRGDTFFDDTTTEPGVVHRYWVAAYIGDDWGPWSDPELGHRAGAAPPPNDDYYNRHNATWEFPLDTTGATVDITEPNITQEIGQGYNTVWYAMGGWNYWAKISTAGSDYDTIIAAYSWLRGNWYPLDHDDDSGPGVTSELVCYFPGPDYAAGFVPDNSFKIASKYPGGGNLMLEVEMLGDAFEPDNVLQDATALISGVDQTHSIDPISDDDWFMFDLTEKSGVTLFTHGDPDSDTELWLYDSDGLQIAHNDDPWSSVVHARIELTCPDEALEPGRYYAQVRAYNDSTTIDEYEMSLEVKSCSTSPYPTPYVSPYPTPTATTTPTGKLYLPILFRN